MPYSVKADIEKKISAARLTALSQGVDGNITNAIAEADDEIDSYLSSIIDSLPLAAPPAKIKQCSVMMAIKNLSPASQFQDLPEWVRKEYEDSIKYLENVSKGIANINVATDVEQNPVVEYDETAAKIFRRNSW